MLSAARLPSGKRLCLWGETKVSRLCKIILLSALAMPASAALAQSDSETRSLKSCRGINDDAQRLACYDRFTDSIGRDITTKPARPYDPIKDFGGGPEVQKADDAARVSSITAKVTEARHTGKTGGWIFAVDTGAVWQQLDSANPRRDPEVGKQVEIKRNSLGGYTATVEGGRAFRVKRIR